MKHRLLKTGSALILLLVLAFSLTPALASISSGYAVVSGTSTLNLRQGPGTQYAWLGKANENDWVQLLGESGNWYQVRLLDGGKVGYMSKNYLSTGSSSGKTTGVVNNPIATQFLNLRQYPSYSAPVLGIFYNGATFDALSVSNGWVCAEITGTGLRGYFRQEYVILNGHGSTATVQTGNSGKLNLRAAPDYSGQVVSQLINGTGVSVLLKGKTFWKVSASGTTGYVDSAFLMEGYTPQPVPDPDPVPVTKGYCIVNNPRSTQYLNLRAQPSTSAKVLAQYKNGIRLEIVEPGETWCKVYGKASGNTGYVMTDYVKLYGVSASPTKTVQNGSTFVNLRSAPSQQTGAVYQRLYSGTVVTVLTPGDEWTQVRYNGQTGYMMSVFLK